MLNKITFKQIYRNLFDDFNKEFLIPCYRESNKAYRASGFFSLQSLIQCSDGIFDLIKKEGDLKIICSPLLSETDIQNIKSGKIIDENFVVSKLIDEINSNDVNGDIDALKLDLICNLIASNIIELKIAFMPKGIYHEKFGIFSDEAGNLVYFNGSFNSTLNGAVNNTESFMVTTSWSGFENEKEIKSETKYFNDLWDDKIEKVRTLCFPDVAKEALFEKFKNSTSVDEAVFKLVQKLHGKKTKELWDFQKEAINQFVDNGFKHFYEMATGTGKTFTSIRTIKKVSELKHKCFAIVLVPQIDLQNQWKLSLEDDGFEHIYGLGGYNGLLRSDQDFSSAIINYTLNNETVVCIAVYDTFFDKYYLRVRDIDGLFIIVDEAHNLTKNYMDKMPLNPAYRLGLSATIERWSEKETSTIVKYFTDDKPTFFYGIEDAIKAKFLSPYEYHPLFTHMTDEEFTRYKSKTKALAQAMSAEKPDEEEISRLRTERSLIVKKSTSKIDLLKELVESDNFDFKNSVVYCGQGKDGEDSIIDTVTKILAENDKYVVSQYTSKTEDRIRVLYDFENGYFDTLIAIKCFDEGVDVPKLDKIYIMASDALRRQTVQRRGRVLRQCKETNKEIAYIFDMMVLPPLGILDGMGVESLLRNEIIRVQEYASLCTNKNIYKDIQDILGEYGFEMEELLNGEDRYN